MGKATYLKSASWKSTLCRQLFNMKLKFDMCDVQIKGRGGDPIPVHSCVLAAGCPFLHQYVKVCRGSLYQREDQYIMVELEQVSSQALNHVVNFLYLGEIVVPWNDVDELKEASEFLQMEVLLNMVLTHIPTTSLEEAEFQEAVSVSQTEEDESSVLITRGIDSEEAATDHDLPRLTDEGEYTDNHDQVKAELQDDESMGAEIESDGKAFVINEHFESVDLDQGAAVETKVLNENSIGKPIDLEDLSGQEEVVENMSMKLEEQEVFNTQEVAMEIKEMADDGSQSYVGPETYQIIINSGQVLEGYGASEIIQPFNLQSAEQGSEMELAGDLTEVVPGDEGAISYLEIENAFQGEQLVIEQQYAPDMNVSEISYTDTVASLQGVKHEESQVLSHFVCRQCGSQFLRQQELDLHMSRVHTDEFPFACSICGRLFKFRTSLKMHVAKHGERKFSCTMCNVTFATKSDATVHMKLHSGQKPYQCTTCGKGYSTRTVFLKHRMKAHGEKVPGLDLHAYECKQCGRGFPLQCELRQHVKIIHGHHYQCQTCLQTFHFQKELKTHIQRDHEGKGEIAKTVDTVIPKLYECYICKKKMRCPSAVQRHLENAHQKVKRHFCDVEGCGYRTYWPYDMKIHKQRHETSLKLAKQMMKIRNDDGEIDVRSMYKEDRENGRKIWKCLECPRTFRSSSAVVTHCEGVHCSIKRFFCNIQGCSYGSYRKSDLQTHLWRHQNSKRLENKLGMEPVSKLDVNEELLKLPVGKRGRPRKRPIEEETYSEDSFLQRSFYDEGTLQDGSFELLEKDYSQSRSNQTSVCHCCGMEVFKSALDKHLEKCTKV